MSGKVIWIVNEYNGPNSNRLRQRSFSRLLRERGYQVYLISGSADFKGGKNALDARSEVINFLESNDVCDYIVKTSDFHNSIQRVLVAIQFQYRIWKYRKQLPIPDVIVSDFAGLFGNVFLRWKKKYKTRIIYDVLDLWPEGFVEMGYIKRNSLIAKLLYSMEHKSYREADGIIFSMQGGRDYIIDKGWSKEVGGDVDTSDIGYLNNGVDLETIENEKVVDRLNDSDLDSDKFKVVYLGSISVMNGLDVLVETAKILQERANDKVLFLLYGCGNQEEQLRKKADDYGLKNIKFKGRLDSKYAMSLLSRSNLNVFTFKDTPLWKYGVSPNKLFMYFASGKPVLSMIKPNYDLVELKKAGISVENQPTIVADVIERFVVMDKTEYEEYCKNAKEIAEEYDYKKLVQVLIKKIEGV